VRRIVHLRWKQKLGPVPIAAQVGCAPSTVYEVLRRCRLTRLSHVDRVTGAVVRRYEHPYPGSLIHVDVKKLGNIPDQGGWRFVGRAQGHKNRAATPGKPLADTLAVQDVLAEIADQLDIRVAEGPAELP
jgi:hypothetical protein